MTIRIDLLVPLHGARFGYNNWGMMLFDDRPISALPVTLTDAATINWDCRKGNIATVTLGGARTFAAPTFLREGAYILIVIQDGTGSRTVSSWNAVFKWESATAPTLTTTAGARDIFTFVCDGTNLYAPGFDVR